MAVAIAAVLDWCAIAMARLHHSHVAFREFAQDPLAFWPAEPQHHSFLASVSLQTWRSLRPLLKRPFRNDIRLYFVHEPRLNADGMDAWASNETGTWKLKIHR